MTTTACDDQFAPDPSSREAAIEAMVREVKPHEWRQGGAMRYQGHLITWGEYVQRRANKEADMKRENMLNHLAHTLSHWPTEYTDMIEPGHGWAWYDEGPDCTLVLCKGEEEIREADYAVRRAELSAAKGWDESRADAIGQNGNDGQHYPDTKTWWTHKPCTLCERQTDAKVSDDRPVCPECVAKGEEEFDASFRVFTEQAFPKQERYQDASGEDWIDEFARTATLEEFRGAMRFTIGKYSRRAGKKDGLISEITKMEDYCRRWREYELARAGQ